MKDVQIRIFTELCKNPADHKTTSLPPVFYWNCPPLSMGQMPRLVASGLLLAQLNPQLPHYVPVLFFGGGGVRRIIQCVSFGRRLFYLDRVTAMLSVYSVEKSYW